MKAIGFFNFITMCTHITELPDNFIFVFGSNYLGVHGAGAAHTAMQHFNAVWGQGEGLQGQSYAIPTKSKRLETLDMQNIKKHVDTFMVFTLANPKLMFYVTEIGCGLANLHYSEVAPLFKNVATRHNVILPSTFHLIYKQDDKS